MRPDSQFTQTSRVVLLCVGTALAAACSTKASSGNGRDAGVKGDGGAAVPTALEQCISACEAESPAAVATLNTAFECAFAECPTCEPDDLEDAGPGGMDAGACPQVGRGPGQFSMLRSVACDQCVAERCCAKAAACVSDTTCAKLNTCQDRCVATTK